MNFTLTTLGSASALPTCDRYPSAHVINIRGRLFLIDCGEGCQIQLRRAGISFLKIEAIFVTHLHGDHIFGIYGLLSTMALMGRSASLTIYAPFMFSSILKHFNEMFADGVKFEIKHIVLSGKSKNLIYSTRNFEIYSFGLNHRIDTFGFLFKEKEPQRNIHKWLIERDKLTLREIALLKNGENVIRENGEVLENEYYTYLPFTPRSYAHCSDTAPFEGEADLVKGVSLLYHEATFMDDLASMAKATCHSTTYQAAKVARDANVGKLIVGHYSSRYSDLDKIIKEVREIFPNSELSKEGKVFEIPLNKKEQ
ncbi:MAG: ribonuclease Z [Bacteroidales bacterium]|nr:ribonuclease Z [Bacteroidales bacterium]